MKNNLNYLKNNLNLCGYTLLRVTNNKILIFKSFYKYTKFSKQRAVHTGSCAVRRVVLI